jgi:hypothetical protein
MLEKHMLLIDQPTIDPSSGRRGRRFESCHPDHFFLKLLTQSHTFFSLESEGEFYDGSRADPNAPAV